MRLPSVRLHTANTRLGKAVELAASPYEVVRTQDQVSEADVVVTTGELTSSAQWFAARLGTSMVVVLPEGAEWLKDQIRDGHITTLVGPDMAVPKPK